MQLKDLQAYEILEKRPIKDLNSEGIILRHKKSGARICFVWFWQISGQRSFCGTGKGIFEYLFKRDDLPGKDNLPSRKLQWQGFPESDECLHGRGFSSEYL